MLQTFSVGLGTLVGMVVLFTVASCIAALPTMYLWNALLPDLFNFQEIGFWQALGINLLSGVLFKPSINVSK